MKLLGVVDAEVEMLRLRDSVEAVASLGVARTALDAAFKDLGSIPRAESLNQMRAADLQLSRLPTAQRQAILRIRASLLALIRILEREPKNGLIGRGEERFCCSL
jgi:hypothetical protein